MRAADYIKSAWGNLKGRKKTGKAMKYLLFTALLIYFIVNSLSSSAKSFTEQISKVPLARTLTVDDDENDSVYNRFWQTAGKMTGWKVFIIISRR